MPTLLDDPAWHQRLQSEFTVADARAITLAGDLSLEQINWSPAPGAWSIGQCLDHLARGNDVYLLEIAKVLGAATPAPVQTIAPGWFGRWFIRTYIEPSAGGRRAPAPKKIVPVSAVGAEILDRYLRSTQQAREIASQARPVDVNRVRFRNPFVPLFRFTVGTGLELLSAHQRRHLLQAERVRQSPGFPAPGDVVPRPIQRPSSVT